MTASSRAPLLSKATGGLVLLTLFILMALSLSPRSSTRFYAWPWHFYWELLLLTPVAWLGLKALSGARIARFGGWIDAGLATGFGVVLTSATLSEFRHQSLN